MDASTLHEAIAEVCPVVSVTVGKSDDRATWTYIPAPGATSQQIADADNVVATIPDTSYSEPSVAEWIGRWTNAEYRAVTAAAWRGAGPNAKDWDTVVFDSPIKMAKKKTTTLKASLVAGGILTQIRADVIFS